jgi:hypothetical protein
MTATPPETLSQAREWQKTLARYLRAGLCHRCAAQAAWAHQTCAGGWSTIHPPCPTCSGIVETFDLATPNPAWRKILRKRL